MFDDFDLKVNCEERGYEEEAFYNWYGETFEDYCDSLQKAAKFTNSFLKESDYDEI